MEPSHGSVEIREWQSTTRCRMLSCATSCAVSQPILACSSGMPATNVVAKGPVSPVAQMLHRTHEQYAVSCHVWIFSNR
eukprot:COSAG02_NODE_3671_length_6396_cov_6.795935_2_plen_79_part_00